MCRILFGCLNSDGEVISGSNGDDPAVDFSVEKIADEIEIYYETPFKHKPSLTVTPNYGPLQSSGIDQQFGRVVVTLNEPKRCRFKVFSGTIDPVDFSFIALK